MKTTTMTTMMMTTMTTMTKTRSLWHDTMLAFDG